MNELEQAMRHPDVIKNQIKQNGGRETVVPYSPSNPPPYPVTSVNGQTGAVSILIGDVASQDIVPVSMGGTGADNAADARTNLGIQLLPTVIVDDTYSTASTAAFDKTYTVSGSGVIVVFASVLSDSTSDYGTWRAHIFHNGNRIFGEGTRWGENLPYSLGASTAVPISVSNGDTIEVYLSHTKGGRKDAYRRFLCFGGCSVS